MATRARHFAREALFLRHRARAASGARRRGAVWGELSSHEGDAAPSQRARTRERTRLKNETEIV